MRTAELAGLHDAKLDPDLQEWDYGGYEGRTTAQIRAERPGWYLWRDGVIPGDADHPGETVAEVGARADAVLARANRCWPTATWRWWPTATSCACSPRAGCGSTRTAGRLFRLDTGTFSTLGTEHDRPVITSWNVPPAV